MPRRGERLGSSENGRVLSEQLNVSLRRGQTKAVKEKAKSEGKTSSKVVQEAIDNWVFDPAKVKAMHGLIKRSAKGRKNG